LHWRLRELSQAGRLAAMRVMRPAIDGILRPTTVYRLK
jgi:hypothetical protein